jgi:hypothetical protein
LKLHSERGLKNSVPNAVAFRLGVLGLAKRLMMTLGNMRENGVRSLAITCGALWCHHEAILTVDDFADDVTVPAFGPRMVCTACGAIGADARPNWDERAPPTLFGRAMS